MAFTLIYCSPMGGEFFLVHSLLEKKERYGKTDFFGWLCLDWGNTAWAAAAD